MASPIPPAAVEPAGPRPIRDLAIAAFGFVTTVLTALLLWVVEIRWGVSLYTWSFLFVIPAGALLSGFAAATGYYVGAKVLGHRPSRLLLANMVLASVGAFFLIHYLSYVVLEIEGKPVRDYVPFSQYLDIAIRSTSMTFNVRSAKVGSTGELGAFGYVPAVLQVLGFAVGGIAVFGWLAAEPFCDRCRRYLTKKRKQVRSTADGEAFSAGTKQVLEALSLSQLDRAVREHAGQGPASQAKGDHLRSTIETRQCKTCSRDWLKFSVERWNGSDWKEVSDFTVEIYSDDAIVLHPTG